MFSCNRRGGHSVAYSVGKGRLGRCMVQLRVHQATSAAASRAVVGSPQSKSLEAVVEAAAGAAVETTAAAAAVVVDDEAVAADGVVGRGKDPCEVLTLLSTSVSRKVVRLVVQVWLWAAC